MVSGWESNPGPFDLDFNAMTTMLSSLSPRVQCYRVHLNKHLHRTEYNLFQLALDPTCCGFLLLCPYNRNSLPAKILLSNNASGFRSRLKSVILFNNRFRKFFFHSVSLTPFPAHLKLRKRGCISWSHAVATRSRRRRGYGFNGKGRVGGARKYDGQLLTALCGGSWTSYFLAPPTPPFPLNPCPRRQRDRVATAWLQLGVLFFSQGRIKDSVGPDVVPKCGLPSSTSHIIFLKLHLTV